MVTNTALRISELKDEDVALLWLQVTRSTIHPRWNVNENERNNTIVALVSTAIDGEDRGQKGIGDMYAGVPAFQALSKQVGYTYIDRLKANGLRW